MGTLKTNEDIKKEISETMDELSWVVEGGDAHDLQDACDKAHATFADTICLIQRLESDATFYKAISELSGRTCDEAIEEMNRLLRENVELSEKIRQLEKRRELIHAYWMNDTYCSNCRAAKARPWAEYLEQKSNTFCHVCGAIMDINPR